MIAIGEYTISAIFDGDSYVIQPSVSSVVIEDSGIYNPSEITFNNKHKQGTGELENYSGRLKIETTSDNTNWTTQYTSSSNEVSKTYSLPSATVDKEPYNFRKSPVVSGSKTETIVGGSLVWNQLITVAGKSFTSSTEDTNGTSLNLKFRKTASPYTQLLGKTVGTGIINAILAADSDITGMSLIHSGATRNINIYADANLSVINGHKYLFSINIVSATVNVVGGLVTKDFQLIDLTTLFGTTIADYIYTLEQSTAGAGVAWVKRYIDLDTYHEYDAGSIQSVEGLESHDVVGFNKWDEETQTGYYNASNGAFVSNANQLASKNAIRVLPNTTYYYADVSSSSHVGDVLFYDGDMNYISASISSKNGTITTPSNCHYIQINVGNTYGNVYNHDICINISDPSRNGTYEPYEKHSYPLDSSVTLRGVPKLVTDHIEFDGDKYHADGSVERRYGIVDLGTLDWVYAGAEGHKRFNTSSVMPNMKGAASSVVANGICSAYSVTTNNNTYAHTADKTISLSESGYIYMYDTAYSDAATFKTAMSGVMLVYELATPTTGNAQPFQSPMLVGTTEEYVSDSIVPVGHESKYTSDIKNIRASLYKAGGTTALLNQITIPVLSQEDFTPKLINTIRQYTKSTSSTSLPSNPTWVDDEEPTIGDNEYMWARLKHVYSDGTFVYSNAVCSTSISGAIHDVDKANKSITDKVWESDITTKINQYDGSTVSTIRDRVSTTETDISGIKTRVSDVESETDDLGTRMTTAETAIDQTANNVVIKATESDTTAAQGGQHLIQSLINVAPSGVTISADKVNIEGAAIFSSGRLSQTSLNNAYDSKGSAAAVQTNLDNLEIGGRNLARNTGERAPDITSQVEWVGFDIGELPITTNEVLTVSFDLKMVIGTAVTNGSPYLQVYNTNYKGKHGQWISVTSGNSTPIFIPIGNYPVGTIIEKRCSCTITTPSAFVEGTMEHDWIEFYSNYSTENAITITNIKVEKGNKATDWSPAPEDQFASTVPCYYRKTTSGAPSAPSSTVGTSNNTDNTWTYVMPLPKKNCYFFICEEYTNVGGTKSYSTVRALDSQTYTSKWVSSSDQTYIDGGSIYTHSITTSQLATDAIKSTNYLAGGTNSPYSSAGTFLDLSNGNFYTPNFGVQSLTGRAYLNGEIIATSGSIGDDSGNYWEIGNTTDSQGNGSASIVGNGTAYIQDGDWQIHSGLSNYSNGSINTQWYTTPQGGGLQLTYPYYDGYYYDYGMTSPVLDTTSSRFYNQTVSQNFLYIRKHASTIPTLESDWNYIFRVDKDGMVWINGQSITQMIQSGVDGGAYVPTSGGTITGNLTVTGTLTATASKANQLTHSISVNGKAFDGSANVTVGTIGAAYGGTGQTSLKAAGTAIIGALDTNTTTPVDNDYIATGSSTFYRKTMSKLWDYIKGKITNDHSNLDSLYVLKSGDTMTGSLTVEDSIYADSAQLGDLVVSGSGRFANGLYGNLTGNADTATMASGVADSGNGTKTTFAYSKSGLSTASWIAAWSGYELRAISPANLLTTIGADKSASISDRINIVGSGNNYNWTSSAYDDKLITSNTLAYWNGAYNSSSHASNIEYVKAGKLGDIVTHNASEFVTTSGNAATATKFNSARTIKLTGDVTGSASGDGSSGWSIATTVADDSHNHTEFTLVPKISKTYASTSYYASTTSNHDTATWYFISVKPDSWYKPWKIKLKVRSFCPSYTNIDSITESTIWGRADSITYSNYTEKYDNGHYYIGVRALKKAGFDAGYSHAVGVDILWATNYATSTYYRTFELDYYYCENCTVTVLDTPLLWGNWSGGTGTNYNNISALDAVTRGYTETGDRNELYAMGLRNYNSAYIKGAIAAESVIVGDVDGYQQVASGVSFDMAYPVLWSTATLAVGAVNYANLFTQIYDRSIANIKSGFTSAANKVIYLVVTISGKTATVDSTVVTDTLPTSDDGKVYIAIGRMGNNSNGQNYFFFWQEKPMYFYKNGAVRQYYNIANATTTTDGLMSSADKTKLNGIETGAQVNTITGVKGNSETNYRTGNVNITASNIGLGNLTNNKQVKGLASGTTSGHLVTWGSDGYTIADSGIALAPSGNVRGIVSGVASNSSGQLVLTYADGTTSEGIDVEFVATQTSSVQKAEALNVNGTAIGGADQPVYFNNQGKPQTANKIPKLNNATTGGTFYAPTGAGTSGQILQSSGGAPSWVNQSTLSVDKATKDSDGNTINTTYLKLAGGKLTGGLEISGHIAGDSDTTGHGLWGGGGYHKAYNNIILHGDATTGSSGIAFVSDKGGTNINAPSDRAFIQFHAYGITTATAENANPTLATSGEANRLVIGVGNDATDEVWLQTPATSGLKHQVGATTYTIPSVASYTTTANYPVISTTTGGIHAYNTSITMNGGTITATTFSGNATSATKFNSNRSIALTGDVTGSTSGTGESGWSIATTVGDDSHNHTTDTIVPKLSKSYTGVIASANDDANCYLYCMKIVPETYNGQWEIKYRVYADMDGIADSNGNGKEESIVYVSGMRNTYATYRTWNNITHTSYRPYYYHNFRFVNEANISYGHICGISLRYAYNPNNATYKRNVTFEILESKNCTVSFFDSPLIYDNVPSTGNYSGIVNFDATTQGNTMTGDRNDPNYEQREYWASRTAYKFCGRYQLLVTRPDGQVFPVNTTDNNITTTKTYDTDTEFDPFGQIFYHYTGGTTAANGYIGDNRLFNKFRMDLRYAFNVGGNNVDSLITARKPFYLVATPQANGLAKIHSSGFSQDLPTSDNGLIYIYLGTVYEDAKPWRLNLTINHPVYWYKNGAVRQFTGLEVGTTFTGAVNFANNTLNLIGDDAYLGDQNVAGCIAIKGKNGATGIRFLPYSGSYSNTISNDGTGVLSIASSNTSNSTLKIINVGGGSSALVLERQGTNAADWQFINASGTLKIQNNYTSAEGDYFDVLSLAYNTGNATFKGTVTAPTFVGSLSGNATSATKATQDASGNTITSYYCTLSTNQTISGIKTFSAMPVASSGINVSQIDNSGGVSLYTDKVIERYGIAFRTTSNSGKHGYVQGGWATYNYMYGDTTNVLTRGWVFKDSINNKGVASISGAGNAVFNGSVTVGGNATNTSGCRQEFDSTLNCLNFIFN